jgi:hypothetical protein
MLSQRRKERKGNNSVLAVLGVLCVFARDPGFAV